MITSEPAPTATPKAAGLVIHLTMFGHTGSFGSGTTILDDGRIIWSDNFGRPIESRLSPQALAQVEGQLESSAALDRSGSYAPELRPGAQPPGHGASGFAFDLVRVGETVLVATNDRTSFEGEEEFWIFPPEMDELSELGRRLSNPVAWLGGDAFIEPIRPYEAERFLVETPSVPCQWGNGTGSSMPCAGRSVSRSSASGQPTTRDSAAPIRGAC